MLLSSSPTGTARSQSPSHKVFSDGAGGAPFGAVKLQGWQQQRHASKKQTPRQRWGMVVKKVPLIK
jgi:hypothetical protein